MQNKKKTPFMPVNVPVLSPDNGFYYENYNENRKKTTCSGYDFGSKISGGKKSTFVVFRLERYVGGCKIVYGID